MTFATSARDTALLGGEARAGGTDVQERRRSGRSSGPIVDISRLDELRGIAWQPDGSATLGALTAIETLWRDPVLAAAYPALAQTSGALATPQIRAVGTIGGNLAQHTRCWYYRNPAGSCYRSGGSSCPARDGDHHFHVVIDLGPCIAPHPSTLAVALLAYDASLELTQQGSVPIEAFLGDGTDPRRADTLRQGELIVAVNLPTPDREERAAYSRASSRRLADWALVECVARMTIRHGYIDTATLAVGGVAAVPLRLREVEAQLVSRPATAETCHQAAAVAARRCRPLPQTGYKVDLLVATLGDALTRCLPAVRA
jgi:xanthine dehydrogenase YagS FAD-binding subunit